MKIIESVEKMQNVANCFKDKGKSVSFVPTMGALHKGHLSLVKDARNRGDFLVVSIFVNPAQFALDEDMGEYPRDIEGDLRKLADIGTDAVFLPTNSEMYPEGFQTYVEVKDLEKPLCGRFRPGHFRGMATVVLKLFNIVKPDVAVFGEKDFQQLKIIERMVKDLNLEIRIVGVPTVRDWDGLALSSRNTYLNKEQRQSAAAISKALREIKDEFQRGLNDAESLVEVGMEILNNTGIDELDYLDIRDSETLRERDVARSGDLVAVAVRIGKARLIDNTKL